MKARAMLLISVSLFVLARQAYADEVSGEAIFEEQCTECHRASNYSGGDKDKLADSIGEIVAGKQKHKIKLTLTPGEVQALARYMTGN